MATIASKKILGLPVVLDTGVTGSDAAPLVAAGVTSRMSLTSWAIALVRLALLPVFILTDAATILIDSALSRAFSVTLNVAGVTRAMGTPTNVANGRRITITVIQDATGGRALTWPAVFKTAWSDTGNTANKRSSISYIYDGTNWNQDGAQTPYV